MSKNKSQTPYFDNSSDKSYKRKRIIIGIFAVLISIFSLLLLVSLNSVFISLIPPNETWALAFLAFPFSIGSIYFSALLYNNAKNETYILGKKYRKAYDYFLSYNFKSVFESGRITPLFYIVVGLITQKFELVIGGSLMLTAILFILTIFEYNESGKNIVDVYNMGFIFYVKKTNHSVWENDDLLLLENSVKENNLFEENTIIRSKAVEFLFALNEMKVEKSLLSPSQEKEVLCALASSCSTRTLDLFKLKNMCFYDCFLNEMIGIIEQMQIEEKTLSADKIIIQLLTQFSELSIAMYHKLEENEKALKGLIHLPKNKRALLKIGNWLKEVAKIRFIFVVYKRVCEKIKNLISKVGEPLLWQPFINNLEKIIDVNYSFFKRVDSNNQEIVKTVERIMKKAKSRSKKK